MQASRRWALLLVLGAGVLVYRTVTMLTDGSATVLVPWVAATIWIELVLDVAAVLAAGRWGVMAMIAWLRRRSRRGHVEAGGAPLAGESRAG